MILIGCPIYKREWLLPYWFEAIEKQTFPLSEVGFVFITGPDDPETLKCLLQFFDKHPELQCFDIEEVADETHASHEEGRRVWGPDRYKTMVNLRNRLLDRVQVHNPDKFFSLDSDILLEDPHSIQQLVKLTDIYDAVAPLMYMTPSSVTFPSVMTWDATGVRAGRAIYPLGTLFEADIIMAAVMMSKPVYTNVRYRWHKQGEDLGWSYSARQAGYKLWSASNIYCPHIMSRSHLEYYLINGDTRKP